MRWIERSMIHAIQRTPARLLLNVKMEHLTSNEERHTCRTSKIVRLFHWNMVVLLGHFLPRDDTQVQCAVPKIEYGILGRSSIRYIPQWKQSGDIHRYLGLPTKCRLRSHCDQCW